MTIRTNLNGQGSPQSVGSSLVSLVLFGIVTISLALAVTGFFTLSKPLEQDDALVRLDNAVLRLMMADELGGEDEFQQGSELLEAILTPAAGKDDHKNVAIFNELAPIAVKIRDALVNADRKTAVEALSQFRAKADAAESQAYRENISSKDSDLTWMLILGCAGLTFCTVLFGFSNLRARRGSQTLTLEKDKLLQEIAQIRAQFDEERQRTIELQQRLMEAGRSNRKLEGSIEDYGQALAKVEGTVKILRAALQDADDRRKVLERELDEKARAHSESLAKISSLDAVIDAAVRSEETLVSQFNKTLTIKEQELEGLRLSEAQARSQLDASQDELHRTIERWNSEAKQEVEALRNEIIQVRAKANSECAVAEWSNTKLRRQVDELTEEVNQLKESLATQSREARVELNKLRTTLDHERDLAIKELSENYEAQFKALQVDARERGTTNSGKLAR